MKNIICIGILLMTGIVSCTTTPDTTSDLNHRAFIDQYFGHFNDHDWSAMAALYAEPAAFKDPSLGFGVHMRRRSDIVQQYTMLSEMIPDVKDSVVSIYPSGDQIIVEFLSTGTAPDGTEFSLPVCSILTIEDGLITSDYTYYDNFE